MTVSMALSRREDVVADIGWLTAISEAMLNRLGGAAIAAGALGPEVACHLFHGGIVFQAGPQPRLGDVNTGDVPDTYRRVARFLKPLRIVNWGRPYLLQVPDDVDGQEATRAWLGRLD